MATLARYALSLLAMSVVTQTAISVATGQGLAGILGGVMGFVWAGWIGLLAGLPLLLAFLWLLPRAIDTWPHAPVHLVAAGLSAGIWGFVVLAIWMLAVATQGVGPSVQSGEALLALAGFALTGGLVGLVEGWTWRVARHA